jgi:hypothetical protein
MSTSGKITKCDLKVGTRFLIKVNETNAKIKVQKGKIKIIDVKRNHKGDGRMSRCK